jgi:hypothetical protein
MAASQEGQEERIRRVSLRLPESLHERVLAASKAEHRSLHGELLYLIERGLDTDSQGEDHGQGGRSG